MSYFSGTANVTPKGGSSVGDKKPGGGVGIVDKHPASGLGSNWSMGDALSSPRGEWDDDLELEEDEFENIDDEIESLAFSSFNITPADSLAIKGTSIGYYGGLGVLGLQAAGHSRNGQIIAEQQLKEYIREALLLEKSKSSISSSGRIAVMSNNMGNPYSLDKASASTNTADAAPPGHLPVNRHGINSKGYGPKSVNTTDGAETLYDPLIGIIYDEDLESFEDGDTTFEVARSYDNERIDNLNTKKHI